MILQRLSAALRKQDWFTVLIELLVVAIGIVLGLQASTWAERRAEQRDETRTIGRLIAEVENADQSRAAFRQSARTRADHLYRVRRMLFGFEAVRPLEPAECIALALSHRTPLPADGLPSLDELIATGRMHILQDESLRRAALDLIRARERAERILQQGRLAPDLGVDFPTLVRAGLVAVDTPEDLDGFDPRPECDIERMRSDPAFLGAFSSNVAAYNAYLVEGFDRPDAAFDRFREALHRAHGSNEAGTDR